MAKVTAPLLSFGATGSIGDSITYQTWRGVKYAKGKSKPANPNTTAQQQVRNIFRNLAQFWKLAPTPLTAAFNAGAAGRSYTGRNGFTGPNVSTFNATVGPTSMNGLLASPSNGGASGPSGITPTAGSEQISIAVSLPEVPAGWTLTSSHAIAFIDQAPTADFAAEIHHNEESGTPETNVITGLTASELYVVCVWLEWEKPDGSVAYSVSLSDTATPTA